MKPYVTFFGDGEHSFALNKPQVSELERSCNATIGTICNRVFVKHFAASDLSEVIRLALIGAGENPKRAAEFVATYVTDRPFSETYPIANAILESVWFGTDPHEGKEK
jgi:hypothetical protein